MGTQRNIPIWAPSNDQLTAIERQVARERSSAAADFVTVIRSVFGR